MSPRARRFAELARGRLGELRRAAARPRVRKAARIALLAVLALSGLYLIVGNALVRFGGLEWIVSRSTPDARVTLGPSYTLWPGRVEVRDLSMRFEDRNVQFELVIPRASAKLGMFALFRKVFHVREVDAEGVRFLFRHKVTSVSGNEKRLVHFPRIEGFADPPLLKPAPPADKTDDWGFRVENVRARGAELWFMEYRYLGGADVRGAFELLPGRSLWVGPARAEFLSGELTIGAKKPLGSRVRGFLDFRFREANPDPIPGLRIFRQISAKAELDIVVRDLEAANLYVKSSPVTRGAGELSVRLALADGRMVPGSFVRYRGTEATRFSFDNALLEAPLRGDLEVSRGSPARLGARLAATDAALSIRAKPDGGGEPRRARATAKGLEASVRFKHTDVARDFELEQASFELAGGRSEDVGAFAGLDSERPMLSGGAAWLSARAELDEGRRWTGTLRVDARRVGVRLGDRRIPIRASLAAGLASSHRDLREGAIRDLRFDVERDEVTQSGAGPLAARLRAATLEWTRFPPGSVKGRADLSSPRIEPWLEMLGAPDLLLGVWPDAPLDVSARVEAAPGAFDLRLDEAESGPFRALGRLRICSPPTGAFLVRSGVFSVGLAVRDGGVKVVPLASDAWLKENAPDCVHDEG